MTTQTKSPPYTPHRKHWLFGDGKEISKGVLDWLKEAEAGAGDIFKAKLPIGKMIATTKPEYIKHVLVDNAKNYHKSVAYQVMKHFLGEGLLTSEGDFWLRQRRLAQPAFHKKKLAAIAHSMSDEARKHMERWKALEKKGGGFDMLSEMMEVTMRIVARALFSAEMEENIGEIGSRIGELNEFAVERTTSLVKLPLWVPTKMARGFKTAAKAVDSVIYRIIEERRAADAQYDDLLSMLMEAKDEDTGEMMNAKQLRDEAVTIFVAGHETTATGMTWAWSLLSQHPEVMDKLRAELKTVLDGRPAEFSDIPNLVYTRQVVDEVLRLYPPAWGVGRLALEDDEIDGYHIPKGTNFIIVAFLAHRRPEIWEDPLAFKPERWADNFARKLPKFAYFPFGGGPRMCIGNNFALMEMTILLATLAQHFNPKLTPDAFPEYDSLITLRPKGEVPMRFV